MTGLEWIGVGAIFSLLGFLVWKHYLDQSARDELKQEFNDLKNKFDEFVNKQ